MTATGQDFTIYAADDAQPLFTVTDGTGAPLDLSSATEIVWDAARDATATAVLSVSMTGGAITFVTDGTDGRILVKLAAPQTTGLTGFYLHRVRVTDAAGNVSTVSLGRMQVGRVPAWSYSGDPSNSDRDAVRHWVGDTDPTNQQLTDPEVDYTLSQFPSPLLAAAQCARTLAGRYARKVNKRVGDLSISYSDLSKNFYALAASLQTQGEQSGVTLYAGGTSLSDMESVRANSDRVPQPFSRGQFDIPNSSGTLQAPPDEQFDASP